MENVYKKVFESVHAEPDHITIRPVSGARDLAVADVHAIIPIH